MPQGRLLEVLGLSRKRGQRQQVLDKMTAAAESTVGVAAGISQLLAPGHVDQLESEGKAAGSNFQNVIDAMRQVGALDQQLQAGKADAQTFTNGLIGLRQVAKQYADEHASPKTSDGKVRLAKCRQVIADAEAALKLQATVNANIDKALAELAQTPPERVTQAALAAVEKMLPYALPRRAEAAQVQLGAIRDAWNTRRAECPEAGDQAALLLEFSPAKPPKSKGQSDSFFIQGTDGRPAYILKPINGESRFSDVWPEGGGAAREIVLSRMNDVFRDRLGLDFGVPKATAVKLEHDSFREGTKSKDRVRVGALQEAVPLRPGAPPDASTFFMNADLDPVAIQRCLDSINPEDAENVGLARLPDAQRR